MKNSIFKILSLTIAIIFTANTIAFSAPDFIYRIRIPEKYGKVKERWKSDNEDKQDKANRTIIVVEDAHENFTAQKNISEIIHTLIPQCDEKNVVVGVEGGRDEISLSQLSAYPIADIRGKVSEEMMKKGYFTGAEHAAITSRYPLLLYGVEDEKLFKKDFKAFHTINTYKPQLENMFAHIEDTMETLKNRMYNKELMLCDVSYERYCNGEESFDESFQYIGELWKEHNGDFSSFPQIELCKEIAVMQSLSSKDALSIERKYALLDVYALDAELRRMFYEVKKILAHSDDELKLIEINDVCNRVRKLLSLEAQRKDAEAQVLSQITEEYPRLLQRLEMFKEKYIVDSKKENYAVDSDLMKKTIGMAQEFYTLAQQREEAMVDNLLKRMDTKDKTYGVLVAGGYHSPGITNILREKNISYLTIRPHIGELSEKTGFMDRMMGRLMPIAPHMTSYIHTSYMSGLLEMLCGRLGKEKVLSLFDDEWTKKVGDNPDAASLLLLMKDNPNISTDIQKKAPFIHQAAQEIAGMILQEATEGKDRDSIIKRVKEIAEEEKIVDGLISIFDTVSSFAHDIPNYDQDYSPVEQAIIKNNLLSLIRVNYLKMISSLRPQGQKGRLGRSLYVGSGPDYVTNFIISGGARETLFVDKLPFESKVILSPEDLQSYKEEYLKIKYTGTYIKTTELKGSVGAKRYLLWELEAMGAQRSDEIEKNIVFDAEQGAYRIRFRFPGDVQEHCIFYYEMRDASEEENYSHLLIDSIQKGIDCYIRKGGDALIIPRAILDRIAHSLNDGSAIYSDNVVIKNFFLQYPRIRLLDNTEIKQVRNFEKQHAIEFGYTNALVLVVDKDAEQEPGRGEQTHSAIEKKDRLRAITATYQSGFISEYVKDENTFHEVRSWDVRSQEKVAVDVRVKQKDELLFYFSRIDGLVVHDNVRDNDVLAAYYAFKTCSGIFFKGEKKGKTVLGYAQLRDLDEVPKALYEDSQFLNTKTDCVLREIENLRLKDLHIFFSVWGNNEYDKAQRIIAAFSSDYYPILNAVKQRDIIPIVKRESQIVEILTHRDGVVIIEKGYHDDDIEVMLWDEIGSASSNWFCAEGPDDKPYSDFVSQSRYIEIINDVKLSQDRPVVAVFDVHGTLLKPTWKEEYRELYKIFVGIEPTDAWIREYVIHKRDNEIIETIATLSGKNTGDIAGQLTALRKKMREEDIPPVMPGALEMVQALHARGVPMVFISGSSRDLILQQLKKTGLLEYVSEGNVVGGERGERDRSDRNQILTDLCTQFKTHTMVYFDDWKGGSKAIKEVGGIYFGIPQGDFDGEREDEEFKANRKHVVDAGADYILNGWKDWVLIDKMITVPEKVQKKGEMIPVVDYEAREIMTVLPAPRDGPIPLYVKVSDDLKWITYYEVTDDSLVFQDDGTTDYTAMDKKEIITIPSTRLITPEQFIKNEVDEPRRSKLLDLLSQQKRYTEYKGIIVSWDLNVDRNVWTTNIDTAFLHDQLEALGVIPPYISLETKDPLLLITNERPELGVYIPENDVMPYQEFEPLMDTEKIESFIEIGGGGGHGTINLIHKLPNLKKAIVTDISIYALRTIKRCLIPYLAEKPDVDVHYYLGKGIKTIDEKVDLIKVNPPYIPTKPTEEENTDGDAYRGTGLIREIIEVGHKNLNPNNPEASIFINVSSLAIKDFDRYIKEFSDSLAVEVVAVGRPVSVPFKDYVLIEPVGNSLDVPLKIGAIDDEWKQWLLKEEGLWEKKDRLPGEEQYWHRLQVYQIKIKKENAASTTETALVEEADSDRGEESNTPTWQCAALPDDQFGGNESRNFSLEIDAKIPSPVQKAIQKFVQEIQLSLIEQGIYMLKIDKGKKKETIAIDQAKGIIRISITKNNPHKCVNSIQKLIEQKSSIRLEKTRKKPASVRMPKGEEIVSSSEEGIPLEMFVELQEQFVEQFAGMENATFDEALNMLAQLADMDDTTFRKAVNEQAQKEGFDETQADFLYEIGMRDIMTGDYLKVCLNDCGISVTRDDLVLRALIHYCNMSLWLNAAELLGIRKDYFTPLKQKFTQAGSQGMHRTQQAALHLTMFFEKLEGMYAFYKKYKEDDDYYLLFQHGRLPAFGEKDTSAKSELAATYEPRFFHRVLNPNVPFLPGAVARNKTPFWIGDPHFLAPFYWHGAQGIGLLPRSDPAPPQRKKTRTLVYRLDAHTDLENPALIDEKMIHALMSDIMMGADFIYFLNMCGVEGFTLPYIFEGMIDGIVLCMPEEALEKSRYSYGDYKLIVQVKKVPDEHDKKKKVLRMRGQILPADHELVRKADFIETQGGTMPERMIDVYLVSPHDTETLRKHAQSATHIIADIDADYLGTDAPYGSPKHIPQYRVDDARYRELINAVTFLYTDEEIKRKICMGFLARSSNFTPLNRAEQTVVDILEAVLDLEGEQPPWVREERELFNKRDLILTPSPEKKPPTGQQQNHDTTTDGADTGRSSQTYGKFEAIKKHFDTKFQKPQFTSAWLYYEYVIQFLKQGDVVYDIGCGRGDYLSKIAQAVGRQGKVVGIDLSEVALQQAHENVAEYENVRLIHDEAAAVLSDITEPADCVIGFNVLDYLPDDATLDELFDAMIQRVKPEGKIFLTVAAREFPDATNIPIDSSGRIPITDFSLGARVFAYRELQNMLEKKNMHYSIETIRGDGDSADFLQAYPGLENAPIQYLVTIAKRPLSTTTEEYTVNRRPTMKNFDEPVNPDEKRQDKIFRMLGFEKGQTLLICDSASDGPIEGLIVTAALQGLMVCIVDSTQHLKRIRSEAQKHLARIRTAGGAITYLAGDITDRDIQNTLITTVRDKGKFHHVMAFTPERKEKVYSGMEVSAYEKAFIKTVVQMKRKDGGSIYFSCAGEDSATEMWETCVNYGIRVETIDPLPNLFSLHGDRTDYMINAETAATWSCDGKENEQTIVDGFTPHHKLDEEERAISQGIEKEKMCIGDYIHRLISECKIDIDTGTPLYHTFIHYLNTSDWIGASKIFIEEYFEQIIAAFYIQEDAVAIKAAYRKQLHAFALKLAAVQKFNEKNINKPNFKRHFIHGKLPTFHVIGSRRAFYPQGVLFFFEALDTWNTFFSEPALSLSGAPLWYGVQHYVAPFYWRRSEKKRFLPPADSTAPEKKTKKTVLFRFDAHEDLDVPHLLEGEPLRLMAAGELSEYALNKTIRQSGVGGHTLFEILNGSIDEMVLCVPEEGANGQKDYGVQQFCVVMENDNSLMRCIIQSDNEKNEIEKLTEQKRNGAIKDFRIITISILSPRDTKALKKCATAASHIIVDIDVDYVGTQAPLIDTSGKTLPVYQLEKEAFYENIKALRIFQDDEVIRKKIGAITVVESPNHTPLKDIRRRTGAIFEIFLGSEDTRSKKQPQWVREERRLYQEFLSRTRHVAPALSTGTVGEATEAVDEKIGPLFNFIVHMTLLGDVQLNVVWRKVGVLPTITLDYEDDRHTGIGALPETLVTEFMRILSEEEKREEGVVTQIDFPQNSNPADVTEQLIKVFPSLKKQQGVPTWQCNESPDKQFDMQSDSKSSESREDMEAHFESVPQKKRFVFDTQGTVKRDASGKPEEMDIGFPGVWYVHGDGKHIHTTDATAALLDALKEKSNEVHDGKGINSFTFGHDTAALTPLTAIPSKKDTHWLIAELAALHKKFSRREQMECVRLVTDNVHKDIYSSMSVAYFYIASALAQIGIKLGFRKISLDADADLKENFLNDLKKNTHIRFVSFSLLHLSIPEIQALQDLCKKIKKIRPDIYIVLGGPMVTYGPDLIFSHIPEANIVLAGEAELAVQKVVGILEHTKATHDLTREEVEALASVPGLFLRSGNTVFCANTDRKSFHKKLNTLIPFMSLDFSSFLLPQDVEDGLNLSTARGCPVGCDYCNQPHGKNYRPLSLEHITLILEQYKTWVDNLPKKDFVYTSIGNKKNLMTVHFTDDDLFWDKKRGLAIVRHTINMGFQISMMQVGERAFFKKEKGKYVIDHDFIKELADFYKKGHIDFIGIGLEDVLDQELENLGEGSRYLIPAALRLERIRACDDHGLMTGNYIIFSNIHSTPALLLEKTLLLEEIITKEGTHFAFCRPPMKSIIYYLEAESFRKLVAKGKDHEVPKDSIPVANHPDYSLWRAHRDFPKVELYKNKELTDAIFDFLDTREYVVHAEKGFRAKNVFLIERVNKLIAALLPLVKDVNSVREALNKFLAARIALLGRMIRTYEKDRETIQREGYVELYDEYSYAGDLLMGMYNVRYRKIIKECEHIINGMIPVYEFLGTDEEIETLFAQQTGLDFNDIHNGDVNTYLQERFPTPYALVGETDPFDEEKSGVHLTAAEADRSHFSVTYTQQKQYLHTEWKKLCEKMGAQGDIEAIFDEIIEKYSEKGRYYHNLDHIEYMLKELENVKDRANDRAALTFAIWFHDIIYDSTRNDNEEKSADCAVDVCNKLKLSDTFAERVKELILITKHHEVSPDDTDAKILIDLDLAILGGAQIASVQFILGFSDYVVIEAAERVLKQYDHGIRKEFSFVDGMAYVVGRSEILQKFLDRDFIYHFDYFREKYEDRAKENLEQLIALLKNEKKVLEELVKPQEYPRFTALEYLEKKTAVYPAYFDTFGDLELDIVKHAQKTYEAVVILVMPREGDEVLDIQNRVDGIYAKIKDETKVTVLGVQNKDTVTKFMQAIGSKTIIRRLRNVPAHEEQLEAESKTAAENYHTYGLETVFIVPSKEFLRLSDDIQAPYVKQCIKMLKLPSDTAATSPHFYTAIEGFNKKRQAGKREVPLSSTTAFYAGSFDPITHGHLEVIFRASKLFEKVYVGVGINPDKEYMFSIEEREEMVRDALRLLDIDNVEVLSYKGLTVDAAAAAGAGILMRGARSIKDLKDELPLAWVNMLLEPRENTFLLVPYKYLNVSSSLVKKTVEEGDPIHELVSSNVYWKFKKQDLDARKGDTRLIGLVGGLGSGKTSVLKHAVKNKHVYGVDLDKVNRELQEDRAVVEQIRDAFGDDVLTQQGKIDYDRLNNEIFNDAKKMYWLKRIMYPLLCKETMRLIDEALTGGYSLIVIEGIRIFDMRMDQILDEVWFVDSPNEKRIERILQKNEEMPPQQAQLIIDTQKEAVALAKAKSNDIIDNSKGLPELFAQLDELLPKAGDSSTQPKASLRELLEQAEAGSTFTFLKPYLPLLKVPDPAPISLLPFMLVHALQKDAHEISLHKKLTFELASCIITEPAIYVQIIMLAMRNVQCYPRYKEVMAIIGGAVVLVSAHQEFFYAHFRNAFNWGAHSWVNNYERNLNRIAGFFQEETQAQKLMEILEEKKGLPHQPWYIDSQFAVLDALEAIDYTSADIRTDVIERLILLNEASTFHPIVVGRIKEVIVALQKDTAKGTYRAFHSALQKEFTSYLSTLDPENMILIDMLKDIAATIPRDESHKWEKLDETVYDAYFSDIQRHRDPIDSVANQDWSIVGKEDDMVEALKHSCIDYDESINLMKGAEENEKAAIDNVKKKILTKAYVIYVVTYAALFAAFSIFVSYMGQTFFDVPYVISFDRDISSIVTSAIKLFLPNALIASIANGLGNYLSQVYEIYFKKERATIDGGRILRSAILGTILIAPLWAVGWYGMLLPHVTTFIGSYILFPQSLIKLILDAGFWTFLWGAWVPYFTGRWYVEQHSFKESLQNTFGERFSKYFNFYFTTVIPFWVPALTVAFVLFPHYAFLITQLVIIPWCALLAYLFHSNTTANIWKLYGALIRHAGAYVGIKTTISNNPDSGDSDTDDSTPSSWYCEESPTEPLSTSVLPDEKVLSMALLFAERGYLSSIRSKAIHHIGNLTKIPEHYQQRVKLMLLQGMVNNNGVIAVDSARILAQLVNAHQLLFDEQDVYILIDILQSEGGRFTAQQWEAASIALRAITVIPDEVKEEVEIVLLHEGVGQQDTEEIISVKESDTAVNQANVTFNEKDISALIDTAENESSRFSWKKRQTAIMRLGIISSIPEKYKDRIKNMLLTAMKDKERETSIVAAKALAALVNANTVVVDTNELYHVSTILENTENKFSWQHREAVAVFLGCLTTIPQRMRDRIKSILFITMVGSADNHEKHVFVASKEAVIALVSRGIIPLKDVYRLWLAKESDYETAVIAYQVMIEILLSRPDMFSDLRTEGFSLEGTQDRINLTVYPRKGHLDHFVDKEKDTVEQWGRSLKITHDEGDFMTLLKIQMQNETDEAFLLEASLMHDDPKIQEHVSGVEMLLIPIDEVESFFKRYNFDPRLIATARIEKGCVQIIKYIARCDYLSYGEERVQTMADNNVSANERELMIKDNADLWINDVCYFLKKYGIVYIDMLSMMHANATERVFALEHLPVGMLENADNVFAYSNLRMSGLADFYPGHYYLFRDDIDVFSFWLIVRHQLFQMILKAANMAYRGGLDEERMKNVIRHVVSQYHKNIKKVFMKIENDKNVTLDSHIIDSLTQELMQAFKYCYGVYDDAEINTLKNDNQGKPYIVLNRDKWYQGGFGAENGKFPAPSLLELINSIASELVRKKEKQLYSRPLEAGFKESILRARKELNHISLRAHECVVECLQKAVGEEWSPDDYVRAFELLEEKELLSYIRFWNAERLRFLLDNLLSLTNKELASALDTTAGAVSQQLAKLGWRRADVADLKETVALIIELRNEDKTTQEIVDVLNERGLKTARGNVWTIQAIDGLVYRSTVPHIRGPYTNSRARQYRSGFGYLMGRWVWWVFPEAKQYTQELEQFFDEHGFTPEEATALSNALIRIRIESLKERNALFSDTDIENILNHQHFNIKKFIATIEKEKVLYAAAINKDGNSLFAKKQIHDVLFKRLIPFQWIKEFLKEGLSKSELLRLCLYRSNPREAWEMCKPIVDLLVEEAHLSPTNAKTLVLGWKDPVNEWALREPIRNSLFEEGIFSLASATRAVISWKHPEEKMRASQETLTNLQPLLLTIGKTEGIMKRYLIAQSYDNIFSVVKAATGKSDGEIEVLLTPLRLYEEHYGKNNNRSTLLNRKNVKKDKNGSGFTPLEDTIVDGESTSPVKASSLAEVPPLKKQGGHRAAPQDNSDKQALALYNAFISREENQFNALCGNLRIDAERLSSQLENINKPIVINHYIPWITLVRSQPKVLKHDEDVARQIVERNDIYKLSNETDKRRLIEKTLAQLMPIKNILSRHLKQIVEPAGLKNEKDICSVYGFHGLGTKQQSSERDIDLFIVVAGDMRLKGYKLQLESIRREIHVSIIGEDRFIHPKTDDDMLNKMAAYKGICLYGNDYFIDENPSAVNNVIDAYMTLLITLDIFISRKTVDWQKKYYGWVKVVVNQLKVLGVELDVHTLMKDVFTERVFFDTERVKAKEKIAEIASGLMQQAKKIDSLAMISSLLPDNNNQQKGWYCAAPWNHTLNRKTIQTKIGALKELLIQRRLFMDRGRFNLIQQRIDALERVLLTGGINGVHNDIDRSIKRIEDELSSITTDRRKEVRKKKKQDDSKKISNQKRTVSRERQRRTIRGITVTFEEGITVKKYEPVLHEALGELMKTYFGFFITFKEQRGTIAIVKEGSEVDRVKDNIIRIREDVLLECVEGREQKMKKARYRLRGYILPFAFGTENIKMKGILRKTTADLDKKFPELAHGLLLFNAKTTGNMPPRTKALFRYIEEVYWTWMYKITYSHPESTEEAEEHIKALFSDTLKQINKEIQGGGKNKNLKRLSKLMNMVMKNEEQASLVYTIFIQSFAQIKSFIEKQHFNRVIGDETYKTLTKMLGDEGVEAFKQVKQSIQQITNTKETFAIYVEKALRDSRGYELVKQVIDTREAEYQNIDFVFTNNKDEAQLVLAFQEEGQKGSTIYRFSKDFEQFIADVYQFGLFFDALVAKGLHAKERDIKIYNWMDTIGTTEFHQDFTTEFNPTIFDQIKERMIQQAA
ncbi:MAG: pantetheine-phosphate adenylyltransferase [Candidatus Omnitrophota bacterium]